MGKIHKAKPSQVIGLAREMLSEKPGLIHIEINKRTGLLHFKIEGFALGEEPMIIKVLEVAAKHIGRPDFQAELIRNSMKREEEKRIETARR